MKFSIRFIFVALTLICCACFVICDRVERQRAAISNIVQGGGAVGFGNSTGVVTDSDNTFLNNLTGTATHALVNTETLDTHTLNALHDLKHLETISLTVRSSVAVQHQLEQDFPRVEIVDLPTELMKAIH